MKRKRYSRETIFRIDGARLKHRLYGVSAHDEVHYWNIRPDGTDSMLIRPEGVESWQRKTG